MKKNSFFLWPSGNVFNAIFFGYKLVPVRRIEEKLQAMFSSGYPVLCSSGRAALFMALNELNISRKDLIGVFPYASHCVLDTVSRVATPLSGVDWVTAQSRVVYHQWSYVQELNLPANTIEDCVDTLCVPGTALFPGGGFFEIWSLPKIVGTTSGGVLWCRDEQTAISIRNKRDNKSGGTFQWFLRLLSRGSPNLYNYWQGAESDYQRLSHLQTGEIDAAINKWEQIVSARLANIKDLLPYQANWLLQPVNRLPPVIPVIVDWTEEKIQSLGILAGYRMMEKIESDGTRSIIKVLPIPIHQDIKEENLQNFVNALHA